MEDLQRPQSTPALVPGPASVKAKAQQVTVAARVTRGQGSSTEASRTRAKEGLLPGATTGSAPHGSAPGGGGYERFLLSTAKEQGWTAGTCCDPANADTNGNISFDVGNSAINVGGFKMYAACMWTCSYRALRRAMIALTLWSCSSTVCDVLPNNGASCAGTLLAKCCRRACDDALMRGVVLARTLWRVLTSV